MVQGAWEEKRGNKKQGSTFKDKLQYLEDCVLYCLSWRLLCNLQPMTVSMTHQENLQRANGVSQEATIMTRMSNHKAEET